MTFTDQTRRLLAAGALAVLATLAAGCGSGDDEKKDAAAKRLTIEETEPSKGRYALKAPRSVEAGLVELSFKNSAKGLADAALIRVDGEHSAREVIEKVVGADDGAPIPAWLHDTGGVGRTAPGQTGFVAQVLKPGTYYILDTDSGEEEGAKAHATTGGVAPLEVTGEAAGKLAATPATITAGAPKEYAFKTEGLTAGTHRVTFSNAGREPHHVVAFPFQKGATLDQVKKSFMSEGPPKGGRSTSRGTGHQRDRRRHEGGDRHEARPRQVRARLLCQRQEGRPAARGQGNDRGSDGRRTVTGLRNPA